MHGHFLVVSSFDCRVLRSARVLVLFPGLIGIHLRVVSSLLCSDLFNLLVSLPLDLRRICHRLAILIFHLSEKIKLSQVYQAILFLEVLFLLNAHLKAAFVSGQIDLGLVREFCVRVVEHGEVHSESASGFHVHGHFHLRLDALFGFDSSFLLGQLRAIFCCVVNASSFDLTVRVCCLCSS